MEPKNQFRKCCSDVSEKFSKSLRDAMVLAEQAITSLDGAKEAVNDARAAFKSSFARRSRSLSMAIAGRRRSRQSRSEHLSSLYNDSKSSYTRQRIKSFSFSKPVGSQEVGRKRQTSLPGPNSSFRAGLHRLKDIRENCNPLPANQSMLSPDGRDVFVQEETSMTASSCEPIETPSRTSDATTGSSSDHVIQPSTGSVDTHASTTRKPSVTESKNIPVETNASKTDRCIVNSISHASNLSIGPGKQPSESTVSSNRYQNTEEKTVSPTERQPIESTLKSWMRLSDETMRDYLKDLQKRSPNAYVLDLLKHRMKEDNISEKTAPNDISNTDSSVSSASRSQVAKRGEILERHNHCGIPNRNVIVIAPEVVGSPHPKRRFFTKSDIGKKDMLNVRKRTSGNVFNKGNVIGTIELTVCFFPVSEQLVLSIRRVQFVEDYKTDREFVYVTTVVDPAKGNQSPFTSESMRLKRRSKSLDIDEDISLQNFGVVDCQDGTARFTVFCYKKWIRRTHICLAEAKINLSECFSSGPGTITAKLIRP